MIDTILTFRNGFGWCQELWTLRKSVWGRRTNSHNRTKLIYNIEASTLIMHYEGCACRNFLVLVGLRFATALLPRPYCSGRIPGHTTREPQVGFELETNSFQLHAIANLDKTSLGKVSTKTHYQDLLRGCDLK